MNNEKFRKSMEVKIIKKEIKKGKPENGRVFQHDKVDDNLYKNPTGDKKIGVSER